ncbi:MAG: hypothetical protein KC417_10025, partial [Myxococcales bacterium]|nr:hypothetical protein [Myxococcales bacterium]
MSIDDEPTEEERRAAEALRDSLDRRPGEGADAAHARDAETVALLRASKDEPLGQARSEGIWERILGVARVPDTKLASRWRRRPMAVAVAAHRAPTPKLSQRLLSWDDDVNAMRAL